MAITATTCGYYSEKVCYVIEAHFELTEKAGVDDNAGKHVEMFKRRARNGQCFTTLFGNS